MLYQHSIPKRLIFLGLAILPLLLPTVVNATSCYIERLTLEEDYNRSKSIVLATITGCSNSKALDNGWCPDKVSDFVVLEILKKSFFERNDGGTIRSAGLFGCGLTVRIGQTLLLFSHDDGYFSIASDYIDYEDPSARLEILRQYRDGEIDDLAGPWIFDDWRVSCGLKHHFSGGSLWFNFDYTERDYDVYSFERLGQDGLPLRRSDGDVIYDVEPSPSWYESGESTSTGPEFDLQTIVLRVKLDSAEKYQGKLITIQVGDKSWPLSWHSVEWRRPNMDPHTSVTAVVGGVAAQEIFNAMRSPTNVAISAKERSPGATGFLATVIATINETLFPARFVTQTTQIGKSGRKFAACIDGSARRSDARFP